MLSARKEASIRAFSANLARQFVTVTGVDCALDAHLEQGPQAKSLRDALAIAFDLLAPRF